jgi:hypothetical protein
MMACANRLFYFGERRVSLSRLEMVVIRPAGGSPDAKVELAMISNVTRKPDTWIPTLEVGSFEWGQPWSNWAMVVRPVGSTTRLTFPQISDERRCSWKSNYAAVAFPALTEERRNNITQLRPDRQHTLTARHA